MYSRHSSDRMAIKKHITGALAADMMHATSIKRAIKPAPSTQRYSDVHNAHSYFGLQTLGYSSSTRVLHCCASLNRQATTIYITPHYPGTGAVAARTLIFVLNSCAFVLILSLADCSSKNAQHSDSVTTRCSTAGAFALAKGNMNVTRLRFQHSRAAESDLRVNETSAHRLCDGGEQRADLIQARKAFPRS
jgi:hypothetical protein